MCYSTYMANTKERPSVSPHDYSELLYQGWEDSHMYQEKFAGTAAVLSYILTYIRYEHGVDVEGIPEIASKTDAWFYENSEEFKEQSDEHLGER